jgi:hypothetical protein
MGHTGQRRAGAGVTFAEDMKRRAMLAGLSIRALAATIPVDHSYLAKIARGERTPPPDLAAEIDRRLDANGALVALLDPPEVEPPHTPHPLGLDHVGHVRGTIARLVDLDTAHGSDGLDKVAARAFYESQRRAGTVGVEPAAAADVHAAIAELGEVAAWLAYDAEEQDASRRLATEALLQARIAGDRDMERFLLSHLAMQAVYVERPAEGLAIADRVLAEQPKSKRVEAMFRLRRARAIGALGGTTEGLAELHQARADLNASPRPEDPQWTWWLHDAELAVHEARLRAAGGDRRGAAEWSERAVAAVPDRQGRDNGLYRAWLLRDLVDAHAWRQAEEVATDLMSRTVGTARVPRIIRATLDVVERPGERAPRWLRDAVRAAAERK